MKLLRLSALLLFVEAAVSVAGTLAPVSFLPITGYEGQFLTSSIGTFTDTDPTETLSNLMALINWGDAQSSAGTITGGDGSFTVTGSRA